MSERMKLAGLTTSSLALILITISGLFIANLPMVRAQPTTLGIFSRDYSSPDIMDPTLTPGSIFVMDVTIDGAPPIVNDTYGGVNGFDITVNYNPSILKATEASYRGPLCPSSAGCLFADLTVLVFRQDADHPPGTTRIALAGIGPANRIEGSGTLYKIKFQVVGTGFTSISISDASEITGPIGPNQIVALPYQILNGSLDNTPPFSLTAFPSSASVNASRSITTSIFVTLLQGDPQNVTLSLTGLPAGAVAIFNPLSGFTTFASELNITTSTATPPGSYTIRINGFCELCAGGLGFSSDTTFTLTVNIPDAAVTTAIPSASQAFVGETLSVSVSVKNEGTLSDTFRVNILANGTIVASQPTATLAPGASETLTLVWNTIDGSPGIYTLIAQIPLLTDEFDAADNTLFAGSFLLKPRPDVAVKAVTPASNAVNPGQTLSISVTVSNRGMSSQDFTLNAFVLSSTGQSAIGTVQVANLAPGQERTVSINWSTSEFNPGLYTIRAEISPLEGEEKLADNSLNSNIVRVNTLPSPDFIVAPTAPIAGGEVTLDASQSSDTDGTVSSYSWNFGDGTTGTGTVVSHRFQSAGSFTVTLTITDNDGASRTKTVTVTVAEARTSFTSTLTSPPGLVGIAVAVLAILALAYFVKSRHKKPAP